MYVLTRIVLQLGVELPEPQQGHLLDLVPTQDGARAVAALQVRLKQQNRQRLAGALAAGHAALSLHPLAATRTAGSAIGLALPCCAGVPQQGKESFVMPISAALFFCAAHSTYARPRPCNAA
jgi:hypothetical protein